MTELTELIKIGGPVTAVAVVFLYFLDCKDKRTMKVVTNTFERTVDVINRNTAAWQKTTDTLVQITKSITQLSITIKKLNGKK